MHFLLSFLPLLSLVFLSACKHGDEDSRMLAVQKKASEEAACTRGSEASEWCAEYSARNKALQTYLDKNQEDFKSFASAALGHGGFPYVLLKLAPELFPDLVKEQGENFARMGFTADTFNPKTGLPLGLNYSPQSVPFAGIPVNTPIQVATLTCGACHIGRVQGPDGKTIELIGAGNSHFDSTGLFKLFSDIVQHKNYTATAVRSAILSKPAGWFYGGNFTTGLSEFAERTLFTTLTEPVLDGIKKAVLEGNANQNKMINQQDYVRAGAYDYFSRTPGRADAVGLTLARYADADQVDKMPGKPTITKIMSVWSQKDRQVSHWTGDMPSGVNPVVAAEVAVIGDVKVLNKDNIVRSTRFIHALPAPPYPFAVDKKKAALGKELYAENCASCHVGDTKVYPVSELGTDPARLGAPSDLTYEGFNKALHDGCPSDRMPCIADKDPILRPRDWDLGYVATPLDGIWARSPYLHNGSVPTLYHLLVPSARPSSFVVGSMKFDTEFLGFEWRQPMAHTELYKTDRIGQYNTGHDTPAYLGSVNWEEEDDKREALIEYMKTL